MCIRDSSSDPYKITPKSYASTRSERAVAVPMVLVSSAQLLRRCDPEKADYYSEITRQMASDIFTYHYKADKECVLETVLSDGSFLDNPAGRTVNPGHSKMCIRDRRRCISPGSWEPEGFQWCAGWS